MIKCPFCSQEEMAKRIIFENGDFYFIKDLYPVDENHYLVVTKKHLLSMASLGNVKLIALLGFIKDCQQSINCQKKPITIFERGNREENKTGNPSIDHAHMHLFFGYYDLCSKLSKSFIIKDIRILCNVIKRHSYYFIFSSISNTMYYGNSRDIPSQFIRKCIGELNSFKEWNWRARAKTNVGN